MHSFFPHPHILPTATTSPPRLDFLLPCNPMNRYLQPGFLCGAPRTPATYRHGIITEILISILRIPLFCGCAWKFHQMQNQSTTLGSEGEKKHNQNLVLTYIAFQFNSQWMRYQPDTPFLNTSPPQMFFLIKKIVHTVEGFRFTFNTWQWKSHIKAENMQDQKNKTWHAQSHLGWRSE